MGGVGGGRRVVCGVGGELFRGVWGRLGVCITKVYEKGRLYTGKGQERESRLDRCGKSSQRCREEEDSRKKLSRLSRAARALR